MFCRVKVKGYKGGYKVLDIVDLGPNKGNAYKLENIGWVSQHDIIGEA